MGLRTSLHHDPSAEALGYYQALLPERIFIEVPHVLFKFTTADENGSNSPLQGGQGPLGPWGVSLFRPDRFSR